MTDTPRSHMQQRARRARERSTATGEPSPNGSPDPEVLNQLEAALLSMPKLRREIFLAVRLDAMSYHQIAEVTGLSVNAIERELARALSDLDHHLRHGHAPPHRHWWERWLHGR